MKRFSRSSNLWWISHVSGPRSAISFMSTVRDSSFSTSKPDFNLRYVNSVADAATSVTSEPAAIHLACSVVLLARTCLPIPVASKCNLTWRKMTRYRHVSVSRLPKERSTFEKSINTHTVTKGYSGEDPKLHQKECANFKYLCSYLYSTIYISSENEQKRCMNQ